MKQRWLLPIVVTVLFPALAPAQAPWQFRWAKGAKIDYKVEHLTQVSEVVDGKKAESGSKLNLVKRWTVLDVDAKGVATLQLTLVALRNEQTRPGGEVLLFDSAALDKSTPALKEMSKFIGKSLATLKIDSFGRLLEVSEGSAAKYEAEPPFALVLPGVAVKEGQAWLRPYNITLEPPAGAGEKVPASQRYHFTKADGKLATMALTTEVKKMPESAQEQIPVFQKMVQGHVVFDTTAGRLHRVDASVDRTVENHEGPGSSYHFKSSYIEQVVE
jgi:hypothetical protein